MCGRVIQTRSASPARTCSRHGERVERLRRETEDAAGGYRDGERSRHGRVT